MLDSNGTFSEGKDLFYASLFEGVVAPVTWDGEVSVSISSTTAENWHVQVIHTVSVTESQPYIVCFKAKSPVSRSISVNIDRGGSPDYLSVIPAESKTFSLTSSYQAFDIPFVANVTDSSSRLTFNLGIQSGDVQLDDIGLYAGSQCGDPSKTPPPPSGSGSDNIVGTPPITTSGNQVLFGGQPGSIAGMSFFWSNYMEEGGKFYTQGVVETLKSDWGAKLVRAVMGVEVEDGYLDDATGNLNRIKTVVDAAIANDMYVIIDWHTHNAEDYQSQAIAFFKEMATTYGTNNNVIYEVYNEPDCPTGTAMCGWDNKTSWSAIKAYAEPVIAAIRSIDPDNLIIVGTPFYSQFVDEASENPINDVNVAYTLHFYAVDHKEDLRNRARTALKNGIPLFVTEWGTVEADGDGDLDVAESDAWLQFLYENNISHANWSISDKVEGASILKPNANATNGWQDGDLTATGLYVKEKIRNW